MELKGISGQNLQVRQLQGGTTLNQIKDATDNNDLQEFVIKNDKGFHVIYAPQLKVDSQYAESDGLLRTTNLTKPGLYLRAGDQVNFGGLKGELVHQDMESNSYDTGSTLGAVAGFLVGTGVGAFLASANATDKLSEGIGMVMGSIPGAFIGTCLGMGAGIGLAHLLAKPEPDENKLKALFSLGK